MISGSVLGQSFLQKLVNAIHLDYVLKIVGVAGFAWTFLSSWHALTFWTKAGMLASVGTWIVGSRFSKIYR